MLNIKKNDNVKVLVGKDKGKIGKVLRVYPTTDRAIVQGVNFTKKHARRTKQDDKGGIIQREAPLNMSNMAVVCKGWNRPIRTGTDILFDGRKGRYCKECKQVL